MMAYRLQEQARVSFNIQSDFIPKLHGLGNKTWKQIKYVFGVELSSRETAYGDGCHTITISGEETAIAGAQQYVMAICGNAEMVKEMPFPTEFEERLNGPNGDRHAELERASWAYVSVSDGIATVRGGDVACNTAMNMIGEYARFFSALKKRGVNAKQYDCLPHSRVRTMLESFEKVAELPTTEMSTSRPGPDISTFVSYFKQLGWSEDNVRDVVKTSGESVDVNTLLTKLMKRYPRSVNSKPTKPLVENPKTEGIASDTNDQPVERTGLRRIVIDGSNVAMSYSNGRFFACLGIKRCVEFFQKRGHEKITCFVPQWRNETSRPEKPIEDQYILDELKKKDIVVYTPSKRVDGKRITSHDDVYIVKYAATEEGIIVSNDFFRDRREEEYQETIQKRLLQYLWADGTFMPMHDPLGKNGPGLDEFLSFPTSKPENSTNNSKDNRPICAHGKKCTFGSKCKFAHPKPGEEGFGTRSALSNTAHVVNGVESERIIKKDQLANAGPQGKFSRSSLADSDASQQPSTNLIANSTQTSDPNLISRNAAGLHLMSLPPSHSSSSDRRMMMASGGSAGAAISGFPYSSAGYDAVQQQYSGSTGHHDPFAQSAALTAPSFSQQPLPPPPPTFHSREPVDSHQQDMMRSLHYDRQQQQQQQLYSGHQQYCGSQSFGMHNQHSQHSQQLSTMGHHRSHVYDQQPQQQHSFGHQMADYPSQSSQHPLPPPPPSSSNHPLPPPPPESLQSDTVHHQYASMSDSERQLAYRASAPSDYPGDMPQQPPPPPHMQSQSRFQTMADNTPSHHHFGRDVYAANHADEQYAFSRPAMSQSYQQRPTPSQPSVDPERLLQDFLRSGYLIREMTIATNMPSREEFVRTVLRANLASISSLSDLTCYVKMELSKL